MRACLMTCVAASLFLGLPASAAADSINYDFTLIATTNNSFSSLGSDPAINAGGVVAFSGNLGSEFGIYTGNGGPATLRVSSYSYGDASTTIENLVGRASINAWGTLVNWFSNITEYRFGGHAVVFVSEGIESTSGYAYDYGSNDTTPSQFTAFGQTPSVNNKNQAAFEADLTTGGSGIFTGSGGPPTLIADTSAQFSGLGGAPAINDAGQVSFNADLQAGGSGIFSGTPAALTTIADTSGPFSGFGVSAINKAGTIAFRADLKAGGQGIFTGDGQTLTTIADTTGPFASFEDAAAININGTVAFLADLQAGGKGLFTVDPGLPAQAVMATGASLFGSAVTGLGFVRDGLNDAGQLAFWAQLADGRQVIAVATPLPNASAAVMTYPGSDGVLHNNAYVVGSDGQLHVDVYDAGSWSWVNLKGYPGSQNSRKS
jgi:hypothetical protein